MAAAAQAISLQNRGAVIGSDPAVLADIYLAENNLAIWNRTLNAAISVDAQRIVAAHPNLQVRMTVAPDSVGAALQEAVGLAVSAPVLIDDIIQVVDMFCFLFELKRAGLRLSVLDRAMCPRFHADQVPCRLVTTYMGAGTEWQDYAHAAAEPAINQMNAGDIALLKGERWVGNEGGGLRHRSPQCNTKTSRLILTLDFSE